MKKWMLHSVCFVANAISVFLIVIYTFYAAFTGDGYGIVLVAIFLGSIYLGYDYWALRLLYRYKTNGELSFTESGIQSVLIVVISLLQIGAGYLTFELIGIHVLNRQTIINKDFGIDAWLSILIGIIFISTSILLVTTFFLERAIKKNQALITNEIDSIGNIQNDKL